MRQRGDATGRLAPRIILQASLEVRSATFYATLINVLAVVPVLFLQSVTGSFFEPLAVSYALAILVSMFVTLMVTPALSAILLSRPPRRREDAPVGRWLKRGYAAALGLMLRWRLRRLAAMAVLAVAGLFVARGFGENLYRRSRSATSSCTGSPPPVPHTPRSAGS
jgi:Cu/Ag efflux pump CusA